MLLESRGHDAVPSSSALAAVLSCLEQERDAPDHALSDETAPSPCNAPVCFLTGQRDRVIGSAGLFRALGLYDRATFTSISGAGHYLPLEQPAVFAAVTQTWLGQCEALLDANEA
jgi:pimeloyl-ACP methyl ester carboxylesterase